MKLHRHCIVLPINKEFSSKIPYISEERCNVDAISLQYTLFLPIFYENSMLIFIFSTVAHFFLIFRDF